MVANIHIAYGASASPFYVLCTVNISC